MESDAEIHNQAPGLAIVVQPKRGTKNYVNKRRRARSWWETKNTVDLSLQSCGSSRTQNMWILHEITLGPLNVGPSFIVQVVCGTQAVGLEFIPSASISSAWVGFLKSILYGWMPYLGLILNYLKILGEWWFLGYWVLKTSHVEKSVDYFTKIFEIFLLKWGRCYQ